ncbi:MULTISPECIES: AGE family epimerase/isomerase [Priestia]|uniref:AGE family epimerase/isomerase n=1 Tax=Priestia TaxID=2800373 RepID=UPI001C8E53F8|nr:MULTISPECIES: AGE family epimerase/isomerase [Priestia]MBY0065080.1 AGE family epimerase/isomerase [Priestia aryabhattai]MDN3363638.1 AGE family epimerase/isomerase [Priestia megaterium]WKU25453.1 AGE family epimerase/isomerase [Priestia megaterium]
MNTATDFSSTAFREPHTLKQHIFDTLHFYYPACIDKKNGGYIHEYYDDGTVNNTHSKHLVSTARFIYIFSVGALLDGSDWCKEAAQHGIHFLQNNHYDREHGGYFFEIADDGEVKDDSKQAYGHAFALLASSIAYQAGISEAKETIEQVYDVMEKYFWEDAHGFYRDEWDASWSAASFYRGQNANMHMCEAMLSAFEATRDKKYLDRAYTLAKGVTQQLAERSGGMIWEHYDTDWQPDWDYNKNNTKDEFRPYGFIPGHQFEWSKLLLWLDRHRSENWMTERAKYLFDKGWNRGWDAKYGGIYFALSPQEEVIDPDKNYWVMAEAISAASLLGVKTGDSGYWRAYDVLFSYCQKHFIDHTYGGWYQLLNQQNERHSSKKSPAPKADYHPVAACYQTLIALNSR